MGTTPPRDPMADYYVRRAPEFEAIYDKPERQADLAELAAWLSTAFSGHDVLEVACGTGYWTQCIARSARSIMACDISGELLEWARKKEYGACSMRFVEADAYALSSVGDGYSAGFHAFWWSHMPVSRIPAFLETFHARLRPGAPVIMIDNAYVPSSSSPIAKVDADGNTFQRRTLSDGSVFEVLKNFPTPPQLEAHLAPHARDIRIRRIEHYWAVEYTTMPQP